MAQTDPVADMLTMIRNANQKFLEKVDIPSSGLKVAIARILQDEGFVSNYKNIEDRKQGILRIYLRYIGEKNKKRVIRGIKRVSRPGLRRFCNWKEIPRLFNGLGVQLLSTSRGVMTDEQARKKHVGGELVCSIW